MTRAQEFAKLLALDSSIKLTYQQRTQVSQLLAFAGATPPLPVITTYAELAALPPGTVLRNRLGLTLQKYMEEQPHDQTPWWAVPGDALEYSDKDVLLPAKVIYLPEETWQ